MKETAKEYPNEKQRAAIAYSYWDRKNLKDSTDIDSWRDFDFVIPYENVEIVMAGDKPWEEDTYYKNINYNPIDNSMDDELFELLEKILPNEEEEFKDLKGEEFYNKLEKLSYKELANLCKKYYPKYQDLFEETFEEDMYERAVDDFINNYDEDYYRYGG